ncbi:MAG: hypothetical protein RL154_1272 [Pseudomonadota bacterium]|jgi:hypothetical protein
MGSIENLHGALDSLIEKHSALKEENMLLKQEVAAANSINAQKENYINDLKSQLEQKSLDLDALVNKISAALGQ